MSDLHISIKAAKLMLDMPVALSLLQDVDTSRLVTKGEVSQLAASWCDEAAARRMLIAAEGDFSLARAKLIQSMQWSDANRQLLEGSLAALASDIRCLGPDDRNCAVVYTCCANQLLDFRPCIELAIAEVERAVTLLDLQGPDGKVVYVYDVFGFSLLKNLDASPVLDCLVPIESYFAERVDQVLVVDLPGAARFMWRLISPLLPPKTRRKVVFVNPQECLALLEARCGGHNQGRAAQTFLQVRTAMMENRSGSSVLSRMHGWGPSTWRGDAGAMGASNARRKQLLPALNRMERARLQRLQIVEASDGNLSCHEAPKHIMSMMIRVASLIFGQRFVRLLSLLVLLCMSLLAACGGISLG